MTLLSFLKAIFITEESPDNVWKPLSATGPEEICPLCTPRKSYFFPIQSRAALGCDTVLNAKCLGIPLSSSFPLSASRLCIHSYSS